MLVKWPPRSYGLKALPMSLGYESYDVRLWRLGKSPAIALTSPNEQRASVLSLRVSPVSERPATSRAQIGAQIWLLTCGFFRSSKAHSPVGLPWVRARSFPEWTLRLPKSSSVSGFIGHGRYVLRPRSAGLSVCPRVTVTIHDRPRDRARVGHDPVIRRHWQVVEGWPSSGPMFRTCRPASVAGCGLDSSVGSSRGPLRSPGNHPLPVRRHR